MTNAASFRPPGLKRMQRRVEVYEQGRIQIQEANIDGKFVKLFNSGSKVSNSHGC